MAFLQSHTPLVRFLKCGLSIKSHISAAGTGALSSPQTTVIVVRIKYQYSRRDVQLSSQYPLHLSDIRVKENWAVGGFRRYIRCTSPDIRALKNRTFSVFLFLFSSSEFSANYCHNGACYLYSNNETFKWLHFKSVGTVLCLSSPSKFQRLLCKFV